MGGESSYKETALQIHSSRPLLTTLPSIEVTRCYSSAKTRFFLWEGEERNRIVDHGRVGGWRVMMVVGPWDDAEGRLRMEKDFNSKMRLEMGKKVPGGDSGGGHRLERPPSFVFRAPREQFTINDFEVGKTYGVGSYSKVVKAKKKDTGKVYALKTMDKKFITKENKTSYVKLERIVLDQLDHPGIIRLFFTFQDAHALYMALESCEGGELFDQIARKGRLKEADARFFAAEVVDALEYLHGLGLIHQDIKPENLLLSSDGHVKIADFGSIKPMKDTQLEVLPISTNEKACSLVGTAAYVPPEVLNSSPATFGNDLWALGCTIYQMLSGSPPFKDASEWLIFQRIIARDLKFPNYFSKEARDLIDRLLDADPNKRLGVGPNGYKDLKSHAFFKGIDWRNLRSMLAQTIVLDSNLAEGDDVQESMWNPNHYGNGFKNSGDRENGTTASSDSSTHISRVASIDSFDSQWQQFLLPGESVIMISMVKKLNKLSSKKVQLILTDKPKLVYVNPAKLVLKKNIMWSDDPTELYVQVATSSHFKVITPKKVRSFEDGKQRAWQWKKTVEGLQNR